jgi:hypothetical protein
LFLHGKGGWFEEVIEEVYCYGIFIRNGYIPAGFL